MKATISDLIANDIVHHGMEQTSTGNYIESFEDYKKGFDDDSKKYLEEHKEDIFNSISCNPNIAEVDFDKDDINMYFYYDGIFDRLDKAIYNASQILGENLEIDEVQEISDEVIYGEDLSRVLTNFIKMFKGYRMEV